MGLLVAFLIAFGVVNASDADKISKTNAEALVKANDLDKDYIIWEVEADDF